MDLTTISSKLDSSGYASVADVIFDLGLIWFNCKLYNQESSAIYKNAEKIEKIFQKKIQEQFGQDYDFDLLNQRYLFNFMPIVCLIIKPFLYIS